MLSHFRSNGRVCALTERTGILVHVVQDILVGGVGQIFYYLFQFCIDSFYLMIRLVFEEYIDDVWKMNQFVFLII